MTYYWDVRFLQHLDNNINNIIEVGARYADETIELANRFNSAIIYSFECNPLTVEICKNKLKFLKNVKFFDHGLGNNNESNPFFSYIKDNNDGASSFYKRIDFENTQISSGDIIIKKLKDVAINENITFVDLLCMDVQGYELNVLIGAEEFIRKIRYIIMEEPKPIINTSYLPENVYSKYIGSPSSREIHDFMIKNNFNEIERINENEIEDNVMYKNMDFE